MRSNVFTTNNVPATSANISNLIRGMTVEQLIFAARLADICTVRMFRAYMGHCTISITRPEDRGKLDTAKTFDFLVDDAYQIYEFPKEARDLLIDILINTRTKK